MTDAAALKACCVDLYSSSLVRWLVGESLHPGGSTLTERLARSLGVRPGDTVLDAACGRGESAVALASTYRCNVIGVDLAPDVVCEAEERAAAAGLAERVKFVCADAEELPLPDESVDGALSECALCLLPDKRRALHELVRVLRPGSRLALADVTAVPDGLPAQLRTLEAHVACVAGAQPLVDLVAVLEDAGFVVEGLEDHSDALLDLVATVEERLRTVRLLSGRLPSQIDEGVKRWLRLAGVAREAVDGRTLGYAAVYASRP